LREQGQSLSQIGDAIGLSKPAVKKILDAASAEPAQGVNFAHGAESLRADAGGSVEPEQLDIEAAIAAQSGPGEPPDPGDELEDSSPLDPDHDPVAAYEAERAAEAAARQMWGDAWKAARADDELRSADMNEPVQSSCSRAPSGSGPVAVGSWPTCSGSARI
jgi:hypothetical protein